MFRIVGALVVALFLVCGCGRKGSPKPPEENAPLSVQFLSATGQVNAVVLSWSAPSGSASGSDLGDISSFVIQRRDVVGEKTGQFEDVGVVNVDPATNLKTKKFSFADTAVQPGRVYDYIVFATAADGLEGESEKYLRITFRGQTSSIEREGAPQAAPKY